jgi:hypothetical protein
MATKGLREVHGSWPARSVEEEDHPWTLPSCQLDVQLDTLKAELCHVHLQAVENGDAEMVGQAWRDVKSGTVQPNIDALNSLLK